MDQTSVRVGMHFTKNLGNYENVKVEIYVETTKNPGESTPQAIDRVHAVVEQKLVEKVVHTEKALKDR